MYLAQKHNPAAVLALESNVSDILGLGGVWAEQTATRQASAANVHILE